MLKAQEHNKVWAAKAPAVIDLDPGTSYAHLQQVEHIERNYEPIIHPQKGITVDNKAQQIVNVAATNVNNSQRINSPLSQNSKTI